MEWEKINKMLQDNVAEPANIGWRSPIVFGLRTVGSFRFWVHHCKPNVDTVRDSYSIPRLDKYINSLKQSTVFFALDTNSGFWETENNENYIQKTVFVHIMIFVGKLVCLLD